MLKNLLLSTLRGLKKKASFSIINILGLAFGIATCLTILLYVGHELSYDSFQKESVYRIALNRIYPEREVKFSVIPHSIGPQMVEDFPEVINQTRFFKPNNDFTFQYGDQFITEENLAFVDSSFLSILSVEVVDGDLTEALTGDNFMVLTESSARRYFGDEDPIGKILDMGGNSLTVKAIVRDYPERSHLTFDALISIETFDFFKSPNWTSFSALTYIELHEDASANELEEKLPAFIRQYAEGEIQQRNGISYDEYIAAGNGYHYSLQPIKDIHLTSHMTGEIKPNGNITYVYIFSVAAIFILIIACINFMNLATARSVERAKEVGIRKVMGSDKKQLIAQFLTESILITLIGSLLALAITVLFQPMFEQLSGRQLSILEFVNATSVALFTLGIVVLGGLSGIYPAMIISSFSPLSIVKGKLQTSSRGILLRNILVVLQFTISIGLISATITVYKQMEYMLNKPLGFQQDQVLIIENGFSVNNNPDQFNWDRIRTFRDELIRLDGVVDAGYSSALPGDALQGFVIRIPGYEGKESLVTRMISADSKFASTMGMEIIEGRSFSQQFNDSLSVIINEATVDKLSLADPIGKKLIHMDDSTQIQYTIVGVIQDFHFESLHSEIEPMVITSMGSSQSFVNKFAVKVNSERIDEALSEIENKWGDFVPQAPFTYYFLDSNLEQFYEAEKTSGRLFTIFTFLAVLVACVGLLGLSAYIITQKTKEIGIRKVLGGSVQSIILLLSKDVLKLVTISGIIAIPLAFFWAKGWLENFAYAISVSWVIFLLSGLGALAIAFLTISIQSTKAALANPVDSLRDE